MVAAALPPLGESEKLTFDGILTKYSAIVVQTVKARGIDLENSEVEEIVYRIVGLQEWPEFRREHYDLHCGPGPSGCGVSCGASYASFVSQDDVSGSVQPCRGYSPPKLPITAAGCVFWRLQTLNTFSTEFGEVGKIGRGRSAASLNILVC